MVINEVYYNGDTDAEWIELYNAGTANADLSGWTITDDTSADALTTSSLILAPDSFAVVVGTSNNDQTVAGGALKIVLGDTGIGNGLANGGDRLILKDNLGAIIDQMNYGDDTAVWDPARAGVASSHSLARSPKGFDTDAPSDFVDLDTPNPGTNPHPPVPVPTPTLEVIPTTAPTPTPSLEFSLRGDKKAVQFTVLNVNAFEKINYEIVYDSSNGEKGIAGSADLSGETTFSRDDLLLGSCPGIEGKVCVYDSGITKLHCKATLFSSGGETVLEKEISY